MKGKIDTALQLLSQFLVVPVEAPRLVLWCVLDRWIKLKSCYLAGFRIDIDSCGCL